MVEGDNQDEAATATADVDESKVSADLHTAPKEGGMYRTADGLYVDAHGNVLKDEEVKRAERVQEIAAKKREAAAQNVPVNTGMAGATMSQAEFDARVQAAVAATLAQMGIPAAAAAKTARSRAGAEA
jgi:hypothetical protein